MLQTFLKKHLIKIGRDAFFRLLEQNGLLIRKQRYRPFTTNSKHFFYKYPNLVTGLRLQRAHQLWVSDITYIPVAGEFAYLSLITDAYSRKIVGFYLSEDMTAKACAKALQMALNQKPPKAATIHHSDRGIQYCSNEYTALLHQHHIMISMTKNGDPYENAIAERVNGILKQEYLPEYFNTINQARTDIAKAVLTYNYHRLHASIDMMTPDQAHTQTGQLNKRWKSRYAKKKELLL